MKKQIVFLLFILFLGKTSFAQFYIGAEATGAYPLGHLNTQVDFGYGPKLNFGYSLSEKLDVSFDYELLNFKTIQPDFKIMSETISAKYKFNTKKYTPYVGIKTGIYHSRVKVPYIVSGQNMETTTRKENAFGIAPLFGVLINTEWSEKVKLNICGSYPFINFKSSSEFVSLSFGLQYYFEKPN